MSQFLTSLKEVRKNYKPYDQWEQQQADDVAQRAYLSKILDLPKDEVELTREKAQTVFRASDMMDKRSEDNCANMEQTTGLIETALTLPALAAILAPARMQSKGKILSPNKQMAIQAGAVLYTLALGLGVILWGNSKQKESSRVGRFQARQHELKDPKNFVMYTPEQIETAKILAKNIKGKSDKKNITQLLNDMKQMSADKQAYKKWVQEKVKNPEDIQKILNTEFSPEQMQQGEKDKEIIVNIVKDVNNSAETYSENVENMFDTITMLSFLTDIPLGFAINGILKKFPKITPIKSRAIQAIALTLAPLGMIFWSTHAKKEASRVGRYTKRQEILDNPELIMSYTPEQLKLAENIKGKNVKKGLFEQLAFNFTFIGTYLKDASNYNKYKKTTAKENEKLYEALKQVDVSDEQLKEAKHLQKSTFRAFEKMDEMSQRYSEDTEAATEIFKEFANFIINLVPLAVMFGVGFAAYKGKMPWHKITKFISRITLHKDSELRKLVEKGYNIVAKDQALKKDFKRMFVDKKAAQNVKNNTELIEVLKQSKGIMQEVQERIEKAFSSSIDPTEVMKLMATMGESRQNVDAFKTLLASLHNQDTQKALEAFQLLSKDEKINKELSHIIEKIDISKIANDILGEHFRQDFISKWMRKFVADITKIKIRSSVGFKHEFKQTNNVFEEIQEKFNYFYKEYKTFFQAALAFFAPVIVIPTIMAGGLSSWLTNIQIKAGRIGVMKAMQEIDNPKLFVNPDENNK